MCVSTMALANPSTMAKSHPRTCVNVMARASAFSHGLRPPSRAASLTWGIKQRVNSAWVGQPGFVPNHLRRSLLCRVLTESAQLEVGAPAPNFELPEPLTGKIVRLADFKSCPALLVMFICNHCPYVVHLKGAIAALAKEYAGKGVGVVAISSNSVQTHPQDGPEEMAKDAVAAGYTFPYLYDESQDIARAYKAACTPEFYVFDGAQKMVYHGQFDDSRPRSDKLVTGADLRAALDAVLAGAAAPTSRPSIGCNIKWHPGSEPDWFGAQQVKK